MIMNLPQRKQITFIVFRFEQKVSNFKDYSILQIKDKINEILYWQVRVLNIYVIKTTKVYH